MYKIQFSDRSVLIVSTEQGDKIKTAQMQKNPPTYVEIDKGQYKLDKVSKIEYLPEDPQPKQMLVSGVRRAHEKSIHGHIFQLFQKELQRPEPRKWEEFRAAAYDYLYSQDSEWCDDRKGTCACKDKPAMPPTTERVKEVMDFMRS